MNGRVNAQRGLAPKNRVVQCAVQLLLFCALNNGAANAGLSGGYANGGVGNAYWGIGGCRLTKAISIRTVASAESGIFG